MDINDSRNVWDGDGITDTFTFSLVNYNKAYNTLEGYVIDNDGNIDATYTWALDLTETEVVLNKPLEIGKQFVFQVAIEKTPKVFYRNAKEVLNDVSLNTSIMQVIDLALAVMDHRTNNRIFRMDMNGQRIVNMGTAVVDSDAISLGQVKAIVGDSQYWAGIAEAQAGIATTKATEAAQSALDAADQVVLAADQVTLAAGQVTLATTQADNAAASAAAALVTKGEVEVLKADTQVIKEDTQAILDDAIGHLPKDHMKYSVHYGSEFEAIAQFAQLGSPTYTSNGSIVTLAKAGDPGLTFPIKDTAYGSKDFEIVVGFDINTLGTRDCILSDGGGAVNELGFHIVKETDNKLRLFVSSTGTTWDIASAVTGTKVFATGTRYQIKFVHNTTINTWEVLWSDDGKAIDDVTKTWTVDISVTNAASMYYDGYQFGAIGYNVYAPVGQSWNGNIYLEDTQFTVDGSYFFKRQYQPYVDNTIVVKGSFRDETNTANLVLTDSYRLTNINVTANKNLYPFVGFDNNIDKNVIVEFADDELGTGLTNITGYKRWLSDLEYVPTESDGSLAYFKHGADGTVITMWKGVVGTANTTIGTNSFINEYKSIRILGGYVNAGIIYSNWAEIPYSAFIKSNAFNQSKINITGTISANIFKDVRMRGIFLAAINPDSYIYEIQGTR